MEEDVLRALNGFAALPGVGAACRFVDGRAGTVVLVAVLVARAWRLRRWEEAVRTGLAAVAADLVAVRVAKPLVDRVRPCRVLEDLVLPAGCGSGEAFPSAHPATTFALAVVLGRPWAWVLALAVALSRVVAGVHWPGDVLGGALLGIGIGLVARLAFRRMPPAGAPETNHPRRRTIKPGPIVYSQPATQAQGVTALPEPMRHISAEEAYEQWQQWVGEVRKTKIGIGTILG